MATINRFEDLEIWQLARAYYNKLRPAIALLRQKSAFRFAEQLQPSAGSVMDNIAEGFERNSRLEFINYLSISKGECGETRSQIHRMFDDQCLNEELYQELLEDSRVLMTKIANFVKYLNNSETKGLKFKNRK